MGIAKKRGRESREWVVNRSDDVAGGGRAAGFGLVAGFCEAEQVGGNVS